MSLFFSRELVASFVHSASS